VNTRLLQLLDDVARGDGSGRIFGAVVGIVTNNQDTDGLGRIKVKFPWLGFENESAWCRVSAPMAGDGRGVYFLPELDDEVVVMFEHGDVRFPFVIGSLWNGKSKAPANNDNKTNDVRVIKSRSGHVVKLNDEKGKETLEIIDGSGKNKIVIDTAKNTITITAEKDLVLSAPNGKIQLTAKSFEATCSDGATLKATGGDIAVDASGNLKLRGGKRVDIN
jgi:uncharacterized protein involved in type VI secretion and phage assembly